MGQRFNQAPGWPPPPVGWETASWVAPWSCMAFASAWLEALD